MAKETKKKSSRKAVKPVKKGTNKAAKRSESASFDPSQHETNPPMEKLSEKEKEALLATYHTTPSGLPRIIVTDPALRNMDVKAGDIIKITRKSYTAGETVFYRGVVDE